MDEERIKPVGRKTITGIAWATHSNRLDKITMYLQGESYKIALLSGRKALAPFRYLILGIWTLLLLKKRKTGVVVAQNPPVFCALFSYFYVRLNGGKLVIDNHSLAHEKASKSILWKILSWIELFTLRKALVNTVIHEGYSKKLNSLGIPNIVLYDSPPEFSNQSERDYAKFEVICPLGGHPDEDVDTIFKLAERIKNIKILITGKLNRPILAPNIEYLGFLPREDYIKKVQRASVGLCLIKENEMTLPYVLFEFASAGLPFLVTKTETTKMLDDIFLVGDFNELVTKLNALRDRRNYDVAVGRVMELKERWVKQSKEGLELLRRTIIE